MYALWFVIDVKYWKGKNKTKIKSRIKKYIFADLSMQKSKRLKCWSAQKIFNIAIIFNEEKGKEWKFLKYKLTFLSWIRRYLHRLGRGP